MPPKVPKMMPLQEFDPRSKIKPESYTSFIGEKRVKELKELARPLKGKSWANINSTLMGGGVAEILRSLVPLARGLGIKAHWYAIRGDDEFFKVTKKFHNMLQGMHLPISISEIFGAYLGCIDENAKNTFIASDMVVVHDPQPAAMMNKGVIYGNVLWRCHIDTSNPNSTVWRFLLPYINQSGGAIFTMPDYIGPGVQVPTYIVSPCIDPLSDKNRQISNDEALGILAPLFNQHRIDPNRPIIAAISRYDIHKNQATVLSAFKHLRDTNKLNPAPYLIFMGNTATDDPEGTAMLEELKVKAGDDPDIKFWVNVKNNDQVVGALMKVARAFVHVSTKEGFGLVVSEALWQGTPVIGSMVGGITKQVVDGKCGFLLNPHDDELIAEKMAYFLNHPKEAEKMGHYGREYVRKNFLLPSLLKNYLYLLRYYLKIDRKPPRFRSNELSYTELQNAFKVRHPNLPK